MSLVLGYRIPFLYVYSFHEGGETKGNETERNDTIPQILRDEQWKIVVIRFYIVESLSTALRLDLMLETNDAVISRFFVSIKWLFIWDCN